MWTELSPCVRSVIFNFTIISLVRLVFAGVYRGWIASALPKPVLQRVLVPEGMRTDKLRKLHENMWYSVWHTFSFTLVITTMASEDWFMNMVSSQDYRWTFYDYPHNMPEHIDDIYSVELAFWISCLFFLAVETVRKDFIEMLVHHASTIGLIGLSYAYSYHRIGLTIMAVHDVGDIFLYSAKFFNYLGLKFLTNTLFVIFVLVFFVFRLVVFPQLIRVTWGPLTGYLPNVPYDSFRGGIILPILLSTLLALHLMWFGLILKMVLHMFKAESKQVERDIRSEDEDEPVKDTTSPENRSKTAVTSEQRSASYRKRK